MLHVPVLGGTSHISRFLLPSGETSLHQAAALRQRTICHYIVEAGASLMKTDLQVTAGGLVVGLSGGIGGLAGAEPAGEQSKGALAGVFAGQRSRHEAPVLAQWSSATQGLNPSPPCASLPVVLLN